MPSYFSACDILVISNSWNPKDGGRFFGSPTKLFEYMPMGRAIVASNLEQINEILSDGENALLYSTGDSDSLKEALVRLIHNPGLRKKSGIMPETALLKNIHGRKMVKK